MKQAENYSEILNSFKDYSTRLQNILEVSDWPQIAKLAEELQDCWETGRQVFICGNGGSAGNAIHLANDFLYGISKTSGSGLRVSALPANSAVLTCLANDEGYDEIFSMQISVQANAGDVLIVMSGSGNSPNIIKALEQAKKILKPEGVILFDSSNVAYLYPESRLKMHPYYGELEYQYQYGDNWGPWFNWLYIDQNTISEIALSTGWSLQILFEDKTGHYLGGLRQD